MRLIPRWPFAIAGGGDGRAEGSLLFAIGSACESVRFGPTDDEALALRCNAIVRKGLDKRAISYDDYRQWRRRNELIFTTVLDGDGALIGFFDVFPLEPACAEALLEGRMNERSIEREHIVPRHASSQAEYLHIATIMVDPKQKSFTAMVAREALLMKFKMFLETHYEPLETRVFMAYAQTTAGEALLRRAGFSAVVLPQNSGQGAALYVLRPGSNQDAFLRFNSAQECISNRHRRGDVLSSLDRRMALVERALRDVIAGILGNDFGCVPANVTQKIQERVTAAKRRDTLFVDARLSMMAEWLEFADLRELQDIILNKLLWHRFELTFQSKSVTELRFGQMAELRNCLRHVRQVGRVTEKEGEAAIIWFEEMSERGKG